MEEGDSLPTAGSIWLGGWSEGNQAAAQALLAKYHDTFPLNQETWVVWTWQSMRWVTDDEPLKERFQKIPHPMVDEACRCEGNAGSGCYSP